MNWKEELKLLKKYNNDEYGTFICNSIEEIMNTIDKQGHSGHSFSIMSKYLIRLLKEKPIYPILELEKNEDDWEYDEITKNYQNKRYTALFKEDTGEYSDVNRVIFVDKSSDNSTWNSGICTKIVDKLFPIEFPYLPSDKPYYVYGEDLFIDENGEDKTNENIGSYNHKKLDYLITPSGNKVELNIDVDC